MNLTIFPNDDENIMKKMYSKPNTEILDLNGDCLMQGSLSVSPGTPTDPSNPPGAGMPKRGTPID
jgi:hypothetical protein